ncbi:MAG: fluoride efflux transporter CrcB [Eubacteriaceae bacterium]|nr:fluoride efflux transporter CrcB [Eubacteriaceae bacterium]
MRKYVYILIGGAIGAVLRVVIKGINLFNYSGNIPINTLIINISGAFILMFFLTVAFEVAGFDANIRLGISTGFLGAFTTFSTLCKETVVLIFNGYYFSAFLYILLSFVLGLATAYAGYILAKKYIVKITK